MIIPSGSNWMSLEKSSDLSVGFFRPKAPTIVDGAKFDDAPGGVGLFTSAAPRCLDRGDVDLLHRQHRLEGALCLTAPSRHRVG